MPRYQIIAQALIEDIEAGKYPVGTLLPTELTLCDTFDVSRYTIREAMRRLFEAGFVARRRGAGTIVLATHRPPAFNQSLESIADVLQYVRDSRLEVADIRKIETDEETAQLLGTGQGEEWIEVIGLRYNKFDARPMALSRIYINGRWGGIRESLTRGISAVADLIEQNYGLRVARMDQTINALVLSAEDARMLKVETNSAALRLTRKYLSGDGQILHVADNRHPADRFTLSMSFDREESRAQNENIRN